MYQIPHLQQTFLLTQMFVHFLVKVVKSLFNLFPGVLFNNFAQFLFVEGQLIANLFLTDTLGDTGFDSLEKMLQRRFYFIGVQTQLLLLMTNPGFH